MRWRAPLVVLGLVAAMAAAAFAVRVELAPVPGIEGVLNPDRLPVVTPVDTGVGEPLRVTDGMVDTGRAAFYQETFGNEVFLTDVLGLIDGALTPWAMARALVALNGGGTSNLRVALARDVVLGDRTLPAGTVVDTGLDVPRGGLLPLGIKMVWNRGHLQAGVTCALCHATVDADTGKVVEGAPNADLAVGLMLALASNTASYYVHTGIRSVVPFATDARRRVPITTGDVQPLPDPQQFEAAVDAAFAAWPPGMFDSTMDLVENPTSIPDSFTAHAHPYGWSGFAMIGPFRGLSALNNNVHALNTDTTAQAMHAPVLFGLDSEVFLGTILQNAPHPRLRYDHRSGERPSAVLAAGDPTPGTPGLIHVVEQPDFPKADYLTTDGLLASLPGFPVWHHINAMSAFQNTLQAPPEPPADPARLAAGRAVFTAAGCSRCHDGRAFTNNMVLPAGDLGAEPTRASALETTERALAWPTQYPPDTPVPLPPRPHAVEMQLEAETLSQLQLAWSHGGTAGGYKVKGLVGLRWTAPYLHDGGVAVGPDAERQVGIPGTLLAGVPPDPANSLRALVDRDLRGRVVAANQSDPRAAAVHGVGMGHEVWVDEAAGFGRDEQDALIAWLLSLTRPAPEAPVAENQTGAKP